MRQVAVLPAGVQIWHREVLSASPVGLFPTGNGETDGAVEAAPDSVPAE